MSYQRNGIVVSPDVAFGIATDGTLHIGGLPDSADGTNYPRGWLYGSTPEQRAELGFTDYAPPPPVDTRFWVSPGVPQAMDTIRDQLKRQVRDIRDSKRNEGTLMGSQPIWTDRDSCSDYMGLVLAVQTGLRVDNSIFKFPDGPKPLANADVPLLAAAALSFVQSLYDAEAAHIAAIDALPDVNAAIAYDTGGGW